MLTSLSCANTVPFYSSQIINVKRITLSNKNCINSRNWLLSKVYKIHPNFSSKGRFDFAFKLANLDFASTLIRKVQQEEAL